jgi:uncharacterized protein
MVVTPYNAQVVLLRQRLDAAGRTDVRVGTVDKFQGQQAPVVFISMVASSIDDVPRGISFLLNRNRLNVAISRAKYAAMIVRSETLTEYLPSTPKGLVELGAFLSLPSEPAGLQRQGQRQIATLVPPVGGLRPSRRVDHTLDCPRTALGESRVDDQD